MIFGPYLQDLGDGKSLHLVPFVLIDVGRRPFTPTLFGHKYPVGLVDEEKILPLGKDITVVGLDIMQRSDLSKDQMIVDLSIKTNKNSVLGGIVISSMSVGILGYVVMDDEIEDVPDGQLCVICLRREGIMPSSPVGILCVAKGVPYQLNMKWHLNVLFVLGIFKIQCGFLKHEQTLAECSVHSYDRNFNTF
ncbi:hypothetical protein V8G54_013718 [Vigna mungo]|uniref:RING-type E3 ubiquitin transferase n=1 Tax=Vigna mungo TaxID=3915 RepID=A0AAQ3NJF3_VIGMU